MPLKRIHIVGCGPRSGTTLLAELMRSSFNIDLFEEHEAPITKLPNQKGKIYLTKRPKDIVDIAPILKLMPNLTVIFMVRDPRDMVVSKHGKDLNKYWASLKFWKAYTPLSKKLENHPRFITIKYEDLATEPDAVQNLILNRIPYLLQTKKFSAFGENNAVSVDSINALGGAREVSISSISTWKNHLPRIKDQIQKHGSISNDLIYYGYEKDSKWESILNEVEPIHYESYWPEYYNYKLLKVKQQKRYIKAIWTALKHTSTYLSLRLTFRKPD